MRSRAREPGRRTVTIRWYFDFISPFAYLQRARIRELASTRAAEYRPILFAGLLQRLDHKGPAEMPDHRGDAPRVAAEHPP